MSVHTPVLLNECLEGLAIKEAGVYVDCTTNRGGHSVEMAKRIGEDGVLICIDLDEDALREARENLEKIKGLPKLHFICSNYRHLPSILKDLKLTHVDGILADLGLSSEELETSGRGFSFLKDEPLLMTFSAHPEEDQTTAYDIVNLWSESTIADILYGFADETYSRRIARAIVTKRETGPVNTTFELLEIIKGAVPILYQHRKTHYATKTFQALRMAVNDELGGIRELLEALPNVLSSNGRACIITFHSTEDRLVKNGFRSNEDTLRILTKKPIIATEEEVNSNPRARSAQLRIAERI